MTIRQLLDYYQRQPWLRVAAHGLLWLLLWVSTEDPDQPTSILARLLELTYAMASFYLLFYGPVPRWWARGQVVGPLVIAVALVLSSGAVIYGEYQLDNPHSTYDFLPAFETYGVLAIFLSSRYFFYAFYNGLILNLAAPSVLKLTKTLYERQLTRQQTEQLTRHLQLDALLSQVSPHFLFNTLNNLYSLLLHADARAPAITRQLAALLRYTDELAGQPWVTLAAETDFIEGFLALVRLRYGAEVRLESHWQLGVAGAQRIPPLLLLPLVENAVKHGLSQSLGEAWLCLRAEVQASEVVVTVANSRVEPLATPAAPGRGLGLSTLRERLALLYPGATPLHLEATATTFQATLRLPLRVAAGLVHSLPAIAPLAVPEPA
ncbi:MAG: sensor histidine kinase [Janthinobacterium lividum]